MPDYITAKKYATLVVAASDSTATGKSTADYVCDGISDQAEINNAINALPAQGGRVVLLEGTYVVDASIRVLSNVALEGQGIATKIKIKDALNVDLDVITNYDTTNGNTNIKVSSLLIDGNKANNTAGVHYGIFFAKVTSSIITNVKSINLRTHGIGISNSTDNVISNNICTGNDQVGISLSGAITGSNYNSIVGNVCKSNVLHGIYLNNSSNNTITGNACQGNSGYGIDIVSNSNGNVVTGNLIHGNTFAGIYTNTVQNNTLTGNVFESNSSGILLYTNSNYNTVSGNICRKNQVAGIGLYAASHNGIIGNLCYENSQQTHNTYDNIKLEGSGVDGYSTYNSIQGNTCRQGVQANKPRYGIRIDASNNYNIVSNNDLYSSGATGNLSDAATGTGTGGIAATWDKDFTFVNIGTSFVNIYPAANGEAQIVDFTGYTKYRLIAHVNKIGTGTQSWRLEDAANSVNGLQVDDASAAGEHELDSGWTDLPAFAIGEIKLIPKGKSTIAADDPVFRRAVLLLK